MSDQDNPTFQAISLRMVTAGLLGTVIDMGYSSQQISDARLTMIERHILRIEEVLRLQSGIDVNMIPLPNPLQMDQATLYKTNIEKQR